MLEEGVSDHRHERMYPPAGVFAAMAWLVLTSILTLIAARSLRSPWPR